MQPQETDQASVPDSLSVNLETILMSEDEHTTVEQIVARIGDKGFGLFLIILSLPSALPVPAPGYSTPFGLILSLVGLQMVFGRNRPWLPQKALQKKISKERAAKWMSYLRRVLHWTEKWIRPRHLWIQQRAGRIFLGFVVVAMSTLMIFPIPLTNTAPAGVIFLLGIALSEDDGLLALAGFCLGILALLFYTYIIYLVIVYGTEGVVQFKEWLLGLL